MLFFFFFAIICHIKGGIMQRYFVKEKINNNFILYDTDIHHIKKVMRCKIGDKIETVYDSTVYTCQITNLEPLDLEIISSQKEDRELPLDITIAISLVNEQKFDLILQKLTELGVSTIIPLKTERSIIKIDNQKVSKKIERWQMICKEASEQSHRTKVPKVENIINLTDLIKVDKQLKLICSLRDNTKKLGEYFTNDIKELLFVIGPEGGFSPKEEELLLNNNYKPVSLGKRVMRVETAAIYVASIISYICEG